MADNTEAKLTDSVACPHCGAGSGGSFSRAVEGDESGPTKVLYKCQGCGRFYTAERVIAWRVIKGSNL